MCGFQLTNILFSPSADIYLWLSRVNTTCSAQFVYHVRHVFSRSFFFTSVSFFVNFDKVWMHTKLMSTDSFMPCNTKIRIKKELRLIWGQRGLVYEYSSKRKKLDLQLCPNKTECFWLFSYLKVLDLLFLFFSSSWLLKRLWTFSLRAALTSSANVSWCNALLPGLCRNKYFLF